MDSEAIRRAVDVLLDTGRADELMLEIYDLPDESLIESIRLIAIRIEDTHVTAGAYDAGYDAGYTAGLKEYE